MSDSLPNTDFSRSDATSWASWKCFAGYGFLFIILIVERSVHHSAASCPESNKGFADRCRPTSCANSVNTYASLSNVGQTFHNVHRVCCILFFSFSLVSSEWWLMSRLAYIVTAGCQHRMSGTVLLEAKWNVCFMVIKFITRRAYLLLTSATPGYST